MAALKRLHLRSGVDSEEIDQSNESDYIRLCCELLADVRDPLDAEDEDENTKEKRLQAEQRADELQAQIDKWHDDKNKALQSEDYELAAAIKKVFKL
jgi:hypothetical protein